VASKNGHIEVIKMAVAKIKDYTSATEMKNFLLRKNSDEKNCFHLACELGHANIVEYFINEMKLYYLLEEVDGDSNTPLHLASINDNVGIATLLITHIDNKTRVNLKNKRKTTALEISCRNQNYELCKNIVANLDMLKNEAFNENPLHIACDSGAHRIVELLLSKGFIIDSLDSTGKNCLDIAIEKKHEEVITVLLDNEKWSKLVKAGPEYNSDDEDFINLSK
jgi:ankyrin repeat protein